VLGITALVLGLGPGTAAGAPGRVVFAVKPPGPQPNVDSAGGASAAVALPDGGAVLVARDADRGLVVARIRANGALDSSFGRAGIARVTLPAAATPDPAPRTFGVPFGLLQLLRAPDGRLIVVGMGAARTNLELPQVILARLTANGELDTTFGQGGVARPGLQASCGSCRPAAIQPDGSIVVSGNTGSTSPPTGPDAPAFFAWNVARLTPRGDLDPRFGQGGIAAVGSVPGRNTGGYATALIADGRIVSLGREESGPQLARLLPTGVLDPSFHGGARVPLPVPFAFAMAAHADGFIDARGPESVLRFGPDGEPDPSFGAGVGVGLPGGPGGLLALPGRSVLVYDPAGFDPRPSAVGDLRVTRVLADGRIEATPRLIAFGFGGGFARARLEFEPSRPLPALEQTSFRVAELVQRPDGSLLAAGGAGVVRYTGEGAGMSTGRFAVGALTPALTIDPAFGGPATTERLTVRIVRERARTVQRLGRFVLRVRYSGTGLARIRVRARARVIAEELEPLFAPGISTVKVPLTGALPRGRVRVRVTTEARSLLADRTVQRLRATLAR
jgi:uncharacterized delta-60 repeat protein